MPIPRAVMRIVWAVDRLVDRVTGGRYDEVRSGPATLRLTTTGRRTGEPRENALYYLEHGGAYAVVASNAGSDKDPAWWLNLQSLPDAEVRIGQRRHAVRARRATEDEAAALWPRFDAISGLYAGYRAGTSRSLPVVLLEPLDAPPAGAAPTTGAG